MACCHLCVPGLLWGLSPQNLCVQEPEGPGEGGVGAGNQPQVTQRAGLELGLFQALKTQRGERRCSSREGGVPGGTWLLCPLPPSPAPSPASVPYRGLKVHAHSRRTSGIQPPVLFPLPSSLSKIPT